MAVPKFPDLSGPVPQDKIIGRLLETIASEELAAVNRTAPAGMGQAGVQELRRKLLRSLAHTEMLPPAR